MTMTISQKVSICLDVVKLKGVSLSIGVTNAIGGRRPKKQS